MTARVWTPEELADARRFVHGTISRGELRSLLFDLLSDVEMGAVCSPIALRKLSDHESAAESRRERDPNEDRIIAACRLVHAFVAGIKRCAYCGQNVTAAPMLDGCRKWNTHEVQP